MKFIHRKYFALIAVAALLACCLPVRAQVTSQRANLLTTTALTNAQTATLNISTNILVGPPYADYLTLYYTSICTNPLVVGNNTVTWKFAFDPPVGTNATGTNFIGGGTAVFVNTGTTNCSGFTNIPAIWWRTANAIQLTSFQTAGQTNGSNGQLIGQTASVFLLQPR